MLKRDTIRVWDPSLFTNPELEFFKGLPHLWPRLYYFIPCLTPAPTYPNLSHCLPIQLPQEGKHSIRCSNLESLVCVFR